MLNQNGINVLSLFDGISCGMVALERAEIKVKQYWSSEIDKYAMQISAKNYPDIRKLGDVSSLGKETSYPKELLDGGCDLIVFGSPCTDLSIAKKNRQGLKGSASGLFFEAVRIIKDLKPKYFLMENVNSMSKESKQIITETLGVEPIMINAALVSAQNRKRLFWVGRLVGDKYEQVVINQPEDRGILLKDILEDGSCDRLKSYCIDANYFKGGKIGGTHQSSKRNYTIRIGQIGKGGQGDRIYSPDGKSVGLSALGGGRGAKTGLYSIPNGSAYDYYNDKIVPDNKAKVLGTNPQSTTAIAGQLINDNMKIRKLTPIEAERLQSLPDNYTEGVSNSQRYKMLGNAFNCDVVAHILSFINNPLTP